MGALIKLLMTVVTQRLQDVCQRNKIIRRWKGGYMPGEECPLQVASIFGIAGRRHPYVRVTHICGAYICTESLRYYPS
jgi:hypothetical protein